MARLLRLLAALLVFATSAFAASGPRVHVSPRHDGTSATFAVGFTAPEASGHQGVVERSYHVSAAAPQHRGCVWNIGRTVRTVAKDQRVRVHLFPAPARWCRGLFKGMVSMEEGPFCQQGQPCPEFATRIQTIGRFRFRVR